jgi:hypothetical protein
MNRPPDLGQLLKQAQQMQEQLAAAQADLATRTFEGSSGGGVVKAVVSGSGELVSLTISPDVIDPGDPEMLADLVVAAVHAASKLAAEATKTAMGGVTGGLDLGGLLG